MLRFPDPESASTRRVLVMVPLPLEVTGPNDYQDQQLDQKGANRQKGSQPTARKGTDGPLADALRS